MNRVKPTYFLLSLLLLSVQYSHATSATNAVPATYIMQVSSNLGCDSLHLQLISKAQETPY